MPSNAEPRNVTTKSQFKIQYSLNVSGHLEVSRSRSIGWECMEDKVEKGG